jgi:hypothetical protein
MRRLIDKSYKIENADFLLYEEEEGGQDKYAILHESWGTVGMGDTIEEAEKELIFDAIIFFQYYLHVPDSALSEEEVEFTLWLSNLMGASSNIVN